MSHRTGGRYGGSRDTSSSDCGWFSRSLEGVFLSSHHGRSHTGGKKSYRSHGCWAAHSELHTWLHICLKSHHGAVPISSRCRLVIFLTPASGHFSPFPIHALNPQLMVTHTRCPSSSLSGPVLPTVPSQGHPRSTGMSMC